MQPHCFLLRALAVAGTTAVGSIPVALIGDMTDLQMGCCIALACGMMMGCSIVLSIECLLASSCFSVALAVALGCLLIKAVEFIFEGRSDLTFGNLKGRDAAAGLVIFFSMLIHSIGEGLSLGVSAIYAEVGEHGRGLDAIVLVSIAIHNIPEGMAICMAFRSKGMSMKRAAWYSFVSNLPQPVSALPAFFLMQQFAEHRQFVTVGLGMAAGAMGYVVIKELIPEALEKLSHKRAAPIMASSCLVVLLLDAFSHFS
jgi:zinc transporter ZupT